MVLDALELEKAVELRIDKMHMDYAFAPCFDPKKLKDIMQDMGKNFERLAKIALFDLTTKAIPQAKGSIEEITELFYALGKSGLVTMPEEQPK